MGWSLSIKETKKGKKYKFYSSNSDSFVNDKWLTRDEIINFIFWDKFMHFLDDFVKESMCFPEGWVEKTSGRIIHDEDLTKEYWKLMREVCYDTSHYDFVEKIMEILSKQGISISVKDKDYQFET